ncbi:MAG: hypothetical protein G8345_06735 [Magnetococcales bacterium]|nr:hypothetical protein [Magnetococcales bacterium]NGZ26567.1 hypothetical protein [Magnetococcales bacterium]
MDQSRQIEQLVKAVESLTTALAREREERVRREKTLRKGLAGVAMAVLLGGGLVWSSIPAQANLPEVIKQIELDFKEINKLLANLNPLVEGLNGMLGMAQKSMASDKGVLHDAGVLITRVKQDSDLMRRFILMSANKYPIHHMSIKAGVPDNRLDDMDASPAIIINNAGNVISDELRSLNYYMHTTVGKASTWMNWMPAAP